MNNYVLKETKWWIYKYGVFLLLAAATVPNLRGMLSTGRFDRCRWYFNPTQFYDVFKSLKMWSVLHQNKLCFQVEHLGLDGHGKNLIFLWLLRRFSLNWMGSYFLRRLMLWFLLSTSLFQSSIRPPVIRKRRTWITQLTKLHMPLVL